MNTTVQDNHFYNFEFPFPLDLLNLGSILQSGQYHFPLGMELELILRHFK